MNETTGTGTAAEMEGLVRAVKDAASDEMVGRLGETASRAIELLDRMNRSNVADALPVIAEMVRTGDLQRLARYARVLGAMEDAVTDDMVTRFAGLAADATMMVDRMNSGGFTRLVQVLGELNASGALDRLAKQLPLLVENLALVEKMLTCMAEASKDVQSQPEPGGGLMPLLSMLRDSENQKALQFFLAMGKRVRGACAD